MELKYLSIGQLQQSTQNVRRTKNDAGMKELKASILAHGLLQNISVIPAGEDEYGNPRFEVIAGSRRHQALRELFEEGHLNIPIPCVVLDPDDAREASIAENVMRESMHPADEYEAFAALAEKGLTNADIGLRFGYEEKHVSKILKLGNVHPIILAAFRKGEIDIESVRAFTLGDSKKEQLAVYDSLKKTKRISEYWVREAFTDKKIDIDDRRVQFVTIEAYEKAGGKLQHDLFAEETWLLNSDLLLKLFDEKLQEKIDKIKAEGWGWVHIEEKEWEDYSFIGRYEKIRKSDAKDKSECGVYVRITNKGQVDVTYLKGKSKAAAKKESKGYSQALVEDLRTYRMQIAQSEIANSPDLAMCMLLMQAYSGYHRVSVDDEDDESYSNYVYNGAAVSFTFQGGSPRVSKERTAAKERMDEIIKGLPLQWLKHETEAERFKALQLLSDADRMSLLAYAVGRTLRPDLAQEDYDADDGLPHSEEAYMQLGNCVPRYWRPTRENFLSRVTQEDLLEIMEEVFGAAHAKLYKAKPKKVLAAYLHEAFAHPEKAHGDIDVQNRLRTWLPRGMAFIEMRKPAAKKRKSA